MKTTAEIKWVIWKAAKKNRYKILMCQAKTGRYNGGPFYWLRVLVNLVHLQNKRLDVKP